MPFPDLINQLPDYVGRFAAKRLDAEGCTVFFATYPAETRVETHTHTTENVGLITAGELILTSNGETVRYGPGDWYHLPANQPHSARFEVETSEIEFWFATD
ncbi:MAG: cupin domain-containing protein [Cyanobacteria bacterium J06626_23]